MITVLTCTYNEERYIGKMIENILVSTFEKFQLLIVDDGSTDRTVEIINSYADKRISLIKKHNSGLADSLNIGLKKAKFSLIARIDADDLICEDRLEKQLDFFQNNNYDVVGSNAIIINEFGKRLGQTNFPSSHKKIKSKLINKNNPIIHPSVMYRKELILKFGGYDRLFKTGQDYELWTRIIDDCKFCIMVEPLIYLRKHKQNISNLRMREQTLNSLISLFKYYNKKKLKVISYNKTSKSKMIIALRNQLISSNIVKLYVFFKYQMVSSKFIITKAINYILYFLLEKIIILHLKKLKLNFNDI